MQADAEGVSHDVGWLNASRRHPGAPSFPGVRAMATVEAEVERGGATSVERRYFLPSSALDARLLARAVRCHWHVENRLHSPASLGTLPGDRCAMVVDVMFHDDLSHLRSDTGPQNMATVRHMAMNLLREPKDKRSLKVRRKSAAWDASHLEALLRQSA